MIKYILAMKLSSAIVDVVVEFEGFREKNTIQVETEKLKISQTGVNERMELLLQSRADVSFLTLIMLASGMYKENIVERLI